jgi:hypothetical protein
LITAIIAIAGCECVPGLVTPKIITPANSSDAVFINAISDQQNITIETDGIKLLNKSSFDASEVEYQKVQAGINYLRFRSDDGISIIYNSPAEFIKDMKYTVFAYGNGFSINTLIIEDTLLPNPDLSTFRIINLLKNSGELDFIFTDSTTDYSYVVSYKSFTSFRVLGSGTYKLTVMNNKQEIVFKSNNVLLNKNTAYNITLTSRNVGGTIYPVCSMTKIGG